MNPHEQAARGRKVARILGNLHALADAVEMRPAELAETLTADQWTRLAVISGSRGASDKTIAMVKDAVRLDVVL